MHVHTILGPIVAEDDLVNMSRVHQSLLDDGMRFDRLVQVLGDAVLSLELGHLVGAVDAIRFNHILHNHQVDWILALLADLPINVVEILPVLGNVGLERRVRDTIEESVEKD